MKGGFCVMTNKERIRALYFSESKTRVEIAKIIGVSSQYVSKVLRTMPEYYKVKQIRQGERRVRYKANKIQAILNKRKQIREQEEATQGHLVLKQAQNAIEMSKRYVG